MRLPTIALTMGDAAGIGAEVIAKTLADGSYHARCRPIVIGDASVMRRASAIVRSSLSVRIVDDLTTWTPEERSIDVIDLALLGEDEIPFGALSARAGDAAYRYLERANELALHGDIDAICTAPLNKAALHAGGHLFPGHTEILATLSGTQDYAMMLTAPGLRVIHVTTHVGIIDAIARVSLGRASASAASIRMRVRTDSSAMAKRSARSCRHSSARAPPGSTSTGRFPPIRSSSAHGAATSTSSSRCITIRATVRSVLGLENGVNITVGLPYVRTSVDHGTAFDIAGTARADAGSMCAALDAAIALA